MSRKNFPEWVPKVGQLIQVHCKYGDQKRHYETLVSNRTALGGSILLFVIDSGHHSDLEYFFPSEVNKWKAKLDHMPWERDVEIFIVPQ